MAFKSLRNHIQHRLLIAQAKRDARRGILDPKGALARLATHARAQRSGKHPRHHLRSPNWTMEGTADMEVLITAYQYRAYLPLAVQSAEIALQHFAGNGGKGGIAVVEDCGKDASWTWLVEQLGKTPVPLRILQPRENIGLAAARNMALRTTSARTLFVLDADNTVHATGLTALHNHLDAHEAAAAYGKLRVVDAHGTHIRDLSGEPPNREFLLTKGNHIDAMALYNTAALKKAGGWDVEMLTAGWGMEDYALWIHWLMEDKLPAFLPEYVGNYLAKPDSMASAYNPITAQQIAEYLRQKYGPQFRVDLSQLGG